MLSNCTIEHRWRYLITQNARLDVSALTSGRGPRTMKTSERIARELVDFIIEQDLAEGSMLPVEKVLGDSLGVGRTTLREALRLLETRGVLTIKPGPRGGPVVRHPRPEDLREALTLNLQFSDTSHRQVLEARQAMESMLARLAAIRITDEALERLKDTVQMMRDNLDDHRIFLRENHRFHGSIAEAGANVVLRVFSETLMSINDGAIVGADYDAARRSDVADAHEAVILALASRNPEAADVAMRTHIVDTVAYWARTQPTQLERPVRWLS